MNQHKGLRSYKALLEAGIPRSFKVSSSWFSITESTGHCVVEFDNGKSRAKFSQGQGGSFEYEIVTLTSPTTQAVEFLAGYGVAVDSRATVNATVNTTIAPANTASDTDDVSIAAGAVVKIANANPNRKSLEMAASPHNLENLRIGSANVGANRGLILAPSGSGKIETRGEVFAYCPVGAAEAQGVAVLELEEIT